jgi:thiol-disulfide isomerase/thioredoxin
MLGNLDMRFQSAVASDLPGFLVNPTGGLERSSAVRSQLASVRGQHRGVGTAKAHRGAAGTSRLPVYGPAPAIVGTQRWFNTPGGRPVTLASLRAQHRVVLIDFWTYSCINCIRTLPQLEAWDSKYRRAGLTIIGVHTPEFPFERDASNVATAVRQDGVRYPVVQDNQQATWNAYANQYWPAEYLIDADGQVRHVKFGEGDYPKTEAAIRALLAEAGAGGLGGMTHAAIERPTSSKVTPETYLGSLRAQGFLESVTDGVHDYGAPPAQIPRDRLAYSGRWTIGPEDATAGSGARLFLNFRAQRVFLVLGSPGRPRRLRVLVDGRPVTKAIAGADVHHGFVTVQEQRLYRLVKLPHAARHGLELRPAAGTHGYAFTFG